MYKICNSTVGNKHKYEIDRCRHNEDTRALCLVSLGLTVEREELLDCVPIGLIEQVLETGLVVHDRVYDKSKCPEHVVIIARVAAVNTRIVLVEFV